MRKAIKLGLFKRGGKMKTINNKIRIVLVAFFAAIMCFASTSLFATIAKAEGESSCPETGIFAIEDKISLKLNDKGGMRWTLKMDEAHYNYIINNETVKVGFIIAPKVLMDKADGDYYGMSQKIVVGIDEGKIYSLTENDGYYYANGCVVNMLEENRKYDYTAAAYIKNGEKIEKQAAVNENSVKSFYNVSNAAILYSGEDYSEKMLGLTAYDWLGTEEFPIKVDAADQYNSLVEKINAGRNFSDKIIEIGKSVDRSGATLNEGYALPTGTREVCDGDAHAYTNGICIKCNKLQTVGVQYLENADKGIYYVAGYTGLGKDVYVLSEYNGKPVTYVKSEAFANKKITKVVLPASVTELKGGVFLNCYNLKYISMTGVETLNDWNANNNFLNCINLETVIVGKMFEVQAQQFKLHNETAVTNPDIYVDGAKSESSISIEYGGDINNLLSGDVYYKGDASKCFEWNFDVNGNVVHGANAHNFVDGKCSACGKIQTEGVLYVLDEEQDCYYVSGYTGTSKEVYVLSEYESKPVSYVKFEAFKDNTNITKVVLPASVTELKGGVFLNCYNLKYISMTGVETLNDWNANNNFLNCINLETVIVGKMFEVQAQQFKLHNETAVTNPDIYVDGAKSESSISIEYGGDINNLLSGDVYYKGDASKCFEWNFDVNGNIVHGANAHNFVDGKCKNCGVYNTMGVVYNYNEAKDCYYVGDNKTLNVAEITILSKYNDGTHGEKDVTFVKYCAFNGNGNITKVVLPASVTSFDGSVFANCANLEYVSMVGIANINVTTLQELPHKAIYGSTNDHTNHNFMNCPKLSTVVVGKNFIVGDAMFMTTNGDAASVNIYTLATSANDGGITLNKDNNATLTGNIYYYSETELGGAWHYVNGAPTLWA